MGTRTISDFAKNNGICLSKCRLRPNLHFSLFARHGRALTGVSPEHAQVVGNV